MTFRLQEDESKSKYAKQGVLSRVENLLQPLKFWQRERSSYAAAETAEQSELQVVGMTRSGKQPVQVGNVTECALLMFSMSLGLDPEATRAANPVEGLVKVRAGTNTQMCTHTRTHTHMHARLHNITGSVLHQKKEKRRH